MNINCKLFFTKISDNFVLHISDGVTFIRALSVSGPLFKFYISTGYCEGRRHLGYNHCITSHCISTDAGPLLGLHYLRLGFVAYRSNARAMTMQGEAYAEIYGHPPDYDPD